MSTTREPSFSLNISRSPDSDVTDGIILQPMIELPEAQSEVKNSTVLFLLDTSSSMEGSNIEEMKSAVTDIIKTRLKDNDTIIILGFHEKGYMVFHGKRSALMKEIAELKVYSGTSFIAAFGQIDPNLFVKENRSLIFFLTDGESMDQDPVEKEPARIISKLEEKFRKQEKPLPAIVSIAVGQGANVALTQQFDRPMLQGLYAANAKEIGEKFDHAAHMIGKDHYPVRVTAIFSEKQSYSKYLGSLQTGAKLQTGGFQVSLPPSGSEIQFQFTVGSNHYQASVNFPDLKHLSYEVNVINYWVTQEIQRIMKRNITKDKKIDQLKELKDHIINMKSNVDHFTLYSTFLSAIDQNIQSLVGNFVDINNVHSTMTSLYHTTTTGLFIPVIKKTKDAEFKKTVFDSLKQKEYQLLSLTTMGEDLYQYVSTKQCIVWQFGLDSHIFLDPENKAIQSFSNKKFTNVNEVVKYVSKSFVRECDLKQGYMFAYILLKEGNSLIKSIACTYLVAMSTHKKHLTPGAIRMGRGINDDFNRVRFWSLYQTDTHVFLLDAMNKKEFSCVDLSFVNEREKLIDYYHSIGLGGVLRELFYKLKYPYPEKYYVTFPRNRLQVLKELYGDDLPDQFVCPITQEIIGTPAKMIEHEFHAYENDALRNWLKVRSTDPLSNLIVSGNTEPASKTIHQMGQEILRNINETEMKMSTLSDSKGEVMSTSNTYSTTVIIPSSPKETKNTETEHKEIENKEVEYKTVTLNLIFNESKNLPALVSSGADVISHSFSTTSAKTDDAKETKAPKQTTVYFMKEKKNQLLIRFSSPSERDAFYQWINQDKALQCSTEDKYCLLVHTRPSSSCNKKDKVAIDFENFENFTRFIQGLKIKCDLPQSSVSSGQMKSHYNISAHHFKGKLFKGRDQSNTLYFDEDHPLFLEQKQSVLSTLSSGWSAIFKKPGDSPFCMKLKGGNITWLTKEEYEAELQKSSLKVMKLTSC